MASRFQRGFTLIELLVVISIIALLIAVLLPALSKSRSAAQLVRCLAGQRQLGTMIFIYADSNKDWLPTSAYSHAPSVAPSAPNWAGISAQIMDFPYTTEYTANTMVGATYHLSRDRKNGIFNCPSDRTRSILGANLASTSYGWNDSAYGLGRNDAFTTVDVKRVKRASIKTASNLVMLADIIKATPGFFEYQHNQFTSVTVAKTVTVHEGMVNILRADGRASSVNPDNLTAGEFDRRN
jgi:prepilin-type N-terminal cleavage/methylation domain-containing protein